MKKQLEELLKEWNKEVIRWEASAAQAPFEPMVRERCLTRAFEIAKCRRDVKNILDKHE